ncbi:phosphonate ABC transporter ATP-binding protein [Bacillus sp. FJAT-44742]|uniref:phosphonate ABC transporter ATP-binding protein n=2 Tax=Bacillaceae TaxID=186817 RepID=UPI000C24DE1A|nr:phosphonate ABC transporter ATP-binding protein [Bacillus sp. FJAT-44742]
MIILENVTVKYPGAADPAIDNLSLSFQKGEFIGVLGRSGAGKSTFIRTINALQEVSSGEIFVDDYSVHSLSDEDKRRLRTKAGMIFQHFHLIPRMTVLQNVLTGRFGQKKWYENLLGLYSEEEKNEGKSVIEQVGLEKMAGRRVEALSGGQKQRVGIARALMQQPDIFLGDEPVASLDPSTAKSIFGILRSVHDEKNLVTIINIHDVEIAKKFSTRIIGLKEGKLAFDGRPEELDDKAYNRIYDE